MDRHIIALGTGIRFKKYTVNFSYNAMIGVANAVTNDVLKPYVNMDGYYDAMAHIFSLGLEYKF
jgi:long-subunit fatty acid transport protein